MIRNYTNKLSNRYPTILLIALLLLIVWSGIKPLHRFDWMIDNLLGFAFVPILFFVHRKFRLSNLSYTAIFVFMALHVVGSHWTYQETPFGFTLADWFGAENRNHYDRMIHFFFGFLFAYPVREVFLRIANAKGFWGLYLPLDVTMSLSAFFEILEAVLAIVIGGGQGIDYIGSQGDVWDAQKDMLLAGIGAVLAMTVTFFINWKYNFGFRQEWKESLSIKGLQPLGEIKLKEILRDYNRNHNNDIKH